MSNGTMEYWLPTFKWLISLGVWLGILEVRKKEVKNTPKDNTDRRPTCPLCGATMKFVWADSDEFGQKETVGAWLCRCRKVPFTSMTDNGGPR